MDGLWDYTVLYVHSYCRFDLSRVTCQSSALLIEKCVLGCEGPVSAWFWGNDSAFPLCLLNMCQVQGSNQQFQSSLLALHLCGGSQSCCKITSFFPIQQHQIFSIFKLKSSVTADESDSKSGGRKYSAYLKYWCLDYIWRHPANKLMLTFWRISRCFFFSFCRSVFNSLIELSLKSRANAKFMGMMSLPILIGSLKSGIDPLI